MKKYYIHLVKRVINVKQLMTIEYIDITERGYSYVTESHDFFEFVYVDNGSIICVADNRETELQQNDFYLIPPHVTHHYKANDVIPTSIFLVCFNCKCNFLELISGKNSLDEEDKQLMSMIFSESKKAFNFPFYKKLILLDKPTFGAQQLVENYIESLLINIARKKFDEHPEITFVLNSVEFKNSIVNDIIRLLQKNVEGNISLDEIQKNLYYSKTYLNGIFKKATGRSIINYYRYLKIEEAKKMIKAGMRIVDISDALSFESPNYFSKVFRSVTGLTPSQYKKTI